MNIYITASGKKDGFGSQYLSKILALMFCDHYNFKYVHTKLYDLDFKQQDKLGENFYKFNKKQTWLDYWEKIFNLEKLYPIYNKKDYDFIFDLTDVIKNNFITMNDDYLYHNFNPYEKIIEISKNYKKNQKLLFIIKEFPKMNLYQINNQNNIINKLRMNYINNIKLAEDTFNVALHKRKSHRVKSRYQKYGELDYQTIFKKLYNKNKNIKFWIFSDGSREDFNNFNFIDDLNATLSISNTKINNITFCFNKNSLESFKLLTSADILILDKSSFGFCAGLLNKNQVIYTDYWDQPYNEFINSNSI
jgi:hypothetical protein